MLPVSIEGVDVKMVSTSSINTLDYILTRNQTGLVTLMYSTGRGRAGSLILHLQQAPACVLPVRHGQCPLLLYAVVCWRGSTRTRDAGQLDRLSTFTRMRRVQSDIVRPDLTVV